MAKYEHACQRSDDDEAVIRNLALFSQFAILRNLPPYPAHRRMVLAKLHRRWAGRTAHLERKAGVAPVDREPRHDVDLWPRDQICDRIPTQRNGEVTRDRTTR